MASYRARIVDMGASLADVVTDVERNDDGSVKVAVSWVKPSDNGTEKDVAGGSSMKTPG
ncbi:hypothetical protein OVA06_02405 [Pseudarthrobacter sp. SL88]|uniref:hypothetical protein n=1 Tax=Pseudarthrobacter sp. SL88 TaxID=2994666 RepID=UPI00227514DF|nr:hypothetical protein [Pseudarthrobacter sp. SL88]MCY1673577.1 hypothetical protein [Pseudarthrobacter sp. SL88]